MDSGLKQRLVGAAVLIALAVIFVPMLLQGPGPESERVSTTPIPPRPATFDSRPPPFEEPERLRKVPPAGEAPPARVPQGSQPQGMSSPTATPLAERRPPPEKAAPSATPEAPSAGLGAWVVQVGSFAAKTNAERMRDGLREQGYSAFVEEKESTGETVYRVRIGPELTRSSADKIKAQLEKTGKYQAIVLRYP